MTLVQRHMFYRLLGHASVAGAIVCLIILLVLVQPLFFLLAEHFVSLRRFLLACLLLAPDPIYRGLPFAISVAIVHDYLRWGRNNEIVSLRMAGMPNQALATPALAAAAAVTVLAAMVSLYISPLASRAIEDIRYGAIFNLSLRLLNEGYLQQIAPDLSISFRKRLGPNEITGVTILDSSKEGEVKYIMAERAELQVLQDPSAKRVLVLSQGNYQVRDSSGQRLAPVVFQKLILPIAESADGSPPVREWHGAYEQHIGVLLDPPPDIVQDANLYGDYTSLGHLRIVAPLSCLGCAIFALGLMVAAPYERRSAPILSVVAALGGVALWQGLLITAYFAHIIRLRSRRSSILPPWLRRRSEHRCSDRGPPAPATPFAASFARACPRPSARPRRSPQPPLIRKVPKTKSQSGDVTPKSEASSLK